MRSTTIYALVDPISDEVRYVGKTIELPRRRLAIHRRDATSSKNTRQQRTHCSRWLRRLYGIGLQPRLAIIETVPPGGDWAAAERKWIAFFSARSRLTNITSGGEGLTGIKRGESFRRLMSAMNIGKKMSADSRRLMREAWTPERKAALSSRVRGCKMSALARQRMRESSARRTDRASGVKYMTAITRMLRQSRC